MAKTFKEHWEKISATPFDGELPVWHSSGDFIYYYGSIEPVYIPYDEVKKEERLSFIMRLISDYQEKLLGGDSISISTMPSNNGSMCKDLEEMGFERTNPKWQHYILSIRLKS